MERFGSIVTFIIGAVFQIVQRLGISGEFLGVSIGQQRPKLAKLQPNRQRVLVLVRCF